MKKVICAAFVGVMCAQAANAGFFDSVSGFLGGDQKTEKAAEVNPEKAAGITSGLVSSSMQLLPLLIQQLNVTEAQATGGMGAIIQAAKGLLSKTEYGTLLSAIPNADTLLSAAPAISTMVGGNASGVMDAMGKYGKTVQQGNDLVSQFKSLGLGADMIPKFTETASGFLSKTDTPEAGDLLTNALGSLKF